MTELTNASSVESVERNVLNSAVELPYVFEKRTAVVGCSRVQLMIKQYLMDDLVTAADTHLVTTANRRGPSSKMRFNPSL